MVVGGDAPRLGCRSGVARANAGADRCSILAERQSGYGRGGELSHRLLDAPHAVSIVICNRGRSAWARLRDAG